VILNVQVGLKLYAHPGRNPGYGPVWEKRQEKKSVVGGFLDSHCRYGGIEAPRPESKYLGVYLISCNSSRSTGRQAYTCE